MTGVQTCALPISHEVTGIDGEKKLTGVQITNKNSGETHTLEADGLFVEIGLLPKSDFVTGLVEMNGYNEIKVDCYCKTSRPGIFAAGDVTTVPFKQIITACGEGAKAALSANEYIMSNPDL